MQEIREILTDIGYSLLDCGKEYRARPLYRLSDNNTSLRINKQTGYWQDFSACISGKFEDLIKLTLNLKTVDEAKIYLETKFHFTPIKLASAPIKTIKIFDKKFLDELEKDYSYWANRGISQKTLELFGGGVDHSGKMSQRYIFPIFNSKNKLIGVSGRDLTNSGRRQKWKHVGNKLEWKYPLQFNLEYVQNRKKIIIVESIGDALSLWEAGIYNFIVAFGVFLSPEMIRLLIKLDPEEIWLAFNNEPDNKHYLSLQGVGNAAAEKAKLKLLRHFDSQQIKIRLPFKKDFNDMNKKEILEWQKTSN